MTDLRCSVCKFFLKIPAAFYCVKLKFHKKARNSTRKTQGSRIPNGRQASPCQSAQTYLTNLPLSQTSYFLSLISRLNLLFRQQIYNFFVKAE